MDIEQKNRELLKEQGDFIRKSLAPTFDDIKDEIIKGKRAQMGEVREWGGVKMRKEANGWVPVREGGEKPKAEGEGGGEQKPQDIGEAAKSASEGALQNAIKLSNDPKVREAAHRELERRKNEEATDTFKAPEDFPPSGLGKHADEVMKERMKNTESEKRKDNGKNKDETKQENKKEEPISDKDKDMLDKFKKLSPEAQKRVLEDMTNPEQKKNDLPDEVNKLLDKMSPEERKKVLERAAGGEKKEESKKEERLTYSDKFDYNNIREWSGEDITDKQINDVMGTLFEEGEVDVKDFKIRAESKNEESRKSWDKVDRLMMEVKPGMWPADMSDKDIKDVIWGAIMNYNTSSKNIVKSLLLQNIEDQDLIEKSHINEFVYNEDMKVSKTGKELKEKFQEQIKGEVEEIREYMENVNGLLVSIGEQPTKQVKDVWYYKIDGWEDKLPVLPMIYGAGYKSLEGESNSEDRDVNKYKYDQLVSKLIDCYIEVLMLNTMINNMKDSKEYKLTVRQAAMLGF